MNQDPLPWHNPDAELQAEAEHTPGFAAWLEVTLEGAVDLKGTVSLQSGHNFVYGVYREDPSNGRYRQIPIPAELSKPEAPPTEQGLIDYVTAQVVAGKRTNTVKTALSSPNIKPGDFATITDQVLNRMPWFSKLISSGRGTFASDIARATIEGALMLRPGQSEAAVGQVAISCQRFRKEFDEDASTVAIVDAYGAKIARPLEHIVTAYNLPKGAGEFKKALRPAHYGPNAVQATRILDEAGLVDLSFWQRLTRIPLDGQSLPVVDMLAEKLESAGAGEVLEPMDGSERAALLERATADALKHAAEQPGRDNSRVNELRRLIAYKGRDGIVSLANLVKVANMIIKHNYKDEITALRPDSAFTDSAHALAVLLKFTQPMAMSDGSEQDSGGTRQESTAFVRMMAAVIENGKSRQQPVIQTVGDIALRYADATPKELAALGEELQFGLPSIDAMRRLQRRPARRDGIYRPGYGKLS